MFRISHNFPHNFHMEQIIIDECTKECELKYFNSNFQDYFLPSPSPPCPDKTHSQRVQC
jgi:hypothetical protein